MAVTPNRTSTNPVIVGGGTYINHNVGYHNTRLVGGIFITDVYADRISNTVTTQRTTKTPVRDNITITRKLRLANGAQVFTDQQYASSDLSTSPQTLAMNAAGTLTIFLNSADPGDLIIVSNPFISDSTADVDIVESGVTGVTLQEFNALLSVDIGQAVITMPASTPVNASGFVVLKVI